MLQIDTNIILLYEDYTVRNNITYLIIVCSDREYEAILIFNQWQHLLIPGIKYLCLNKSYMLLKDKTCAHYLNQNIHKEGLFKITTEPAPKI